MIRLLDSNVLIQLMRGRNAAVAARFEAIRSDRTCICSIVRTELVFGALRSRAPVENLESVRTWLARFESLPFDDSAADHAAAIHANLAAQGTVIGVADMLIAAIALAHEAVMVTHNTREFARVPGLLLEDWEA